MKKALIYLLLITGAIAFVYPFIWMLGASLSTESEISKLVLFPSSVSLSNYFKVIDGVDNKAKFGFRISSSLQHSG